MLTAIPASAPFSDDGERVEHAMELWRETVPLPGTPGDAYLQNRGVAFCGTALRWHPNCPFGERTRYGCVVALVRNIITNEPQAIHRTALDHAGNKIDRKAMGPTAGGAIKLEHHEYVTQSVAIGEGIETTLSICQLFDTSTMSVWSVLCDGGIATFPVLPGIETLWIVVDHDPAGIKAARKCAALWLAEGRDVMMLTPQLKGADLNDVVIRHG